MAQYAIDYFNYAIDAAWVTSNAGTMEGNAGPIDAPHCSSILTLDSPPNKRIMAIIRDNHRHHSPGKPEDIINDLKRKVINPQPE